MPIELLAPAGSPSSLKAAVEAGADAVYMGSVWNARMRARNFTREELAKAIRYCHDSSVKAYITLNTLIFQNELKQIEEYLKFIYEYGADAVIVQDLGVAAIANEIGNDMELHASTQMSTHNSKTAKILKSMGFSRAILARELSLEQASAIGKNAGIDTEVFCHGALCYSYSGKCYFSMVQTGRSANRGACAQLCRIPWKMRCNGKCIARGYLTSAKDLSTIEKVSEIEKAGIKCLKIEGRLKGPSYVGAVVSAYRKAIDTGEKADLSRLTQRGYTTGYLFGEAKSSRLTNPRASSFSGAEIGKVTSASKDGAEIRLIGKLSKGDLIRSTSSKKVTEIYRLYRNGKEVDYATGNCTVMIKTLKPGDKVFRVEREEVDEEFLARIRTEPVRVLSKERIKIFKTFSGEHYPQLIYLEDEKELERKTNGMAIIPLDMASAGNLKKARVNFNGFAIDTPRVIFDAEMNDVEERLRRTKENGPSAFMASDLSMVSDYPTIVDGYANVTNAMAAAQWGMVGNVTAIVGSPEVPKDAAPKMGLIPFGRRTIELMISENDLVMDNKADMAQGCELVDPRGERFSIIRKEGRTVIVSRRKIN
jgi:collagenase-like PrtC family protease